MSDLLSRLQQASGRSAVELVAGPAGQLEVLLDAPAGACRGVACIGHPQPLMGGDARHKIPDLMARTLRELGWLAVRPNFRGAGRSEGEYDHGVGEACDVLAVIDWLAPQTPGLPVALLGFSFGAFVQARVAAALAGRGTPAVRLALAGMPAGQVPSGRTFETPAVPPDALVMHGERDEIVPLANLLAWARPAGHPIVVVPGADHFFKGRLPLLRAVIAAHFDAAHDAG